MPSELAAADAAHWNADSIHQHLTERLLDRRISADELLVETALSAQYGVSRTPVREALSRLADADLLVRTARGYRARLWTPTEVLDLYQARIALESEAAAEAAERWLPLDLARLEHFSEQAGTASEAEGVLRANGQWHLTFRAACHNAALIGLLERVSLQLRAAEANDTTAQDVKRNEEDHLAILAALRNRDATAARELMRAHLERVRDLRTQQFARAD